MNLKSFLIGSVMLAGLSGLSGCKPEKAYAERNEPPAYFTSVPAYDGAAVAITSGDFNEDGHLDFILTTNYNPGSSTQSKTYLYLGDGKGNFYNPKAK